jgi:lipoyl(octanoyl) transferase
MVAVRSPLTPTASRSGAPAPASLSGGERRTLQVARLGTIDYLEAWDLQRRLAEARGDDRIGDTLLLLEHPHTYTLGRRGNRENILLTPRQLSRRGITVYEVDRGGDVTYHGPEQLVGYPILKLAPGYTYVGYIRDLERALLEAVRDLGVPAMLNEGYSGVWIGEEKVCALGVKVDAHGITSHGFALNVNTDLSYFDHIIPCGIADKGVTSLQRVLGRRVSPQRVEQLVVAHLCALFGYVPGTRAIGRRRLEKQLSRPAD